MKNEYQDHWITTYTGKRFHYLKPSPDEIDIIDIAHHLSLLCRFTGACQRLYTVGEHSLRVCDILPDELKLAGLLHDAAEAYINDISRPVKHTHKLDKTEKKIEMAIAKRFGVSFEDPRIKKADNILIATEARDLMPNMTGWAKLPTPLRQPVIPLGSDAVEFLFLHTFKQLGGYKRIGVYHV